MRRAACGGDAYKSRERKINYHVSVRALLLQTDVTVYGGMEFD